MLRVPQFPAGQGLHLLIERGANNLLNRRRILSAQVLTSAGVEVVSD